MISNCRNCTHIASGICTNDVKITEPFMAEKRWGKNKSSLYKYPGICAPRAAPMANSVPEHLRNDFRPR